MSDVIQSDREWAEWAYLECYEQHPNDEWLKALLAGKHDDDPQVELLARHRIASEAALRERVAVLEGAAKQARDQFAFYTDEHRKAGKYEKALTNQRFVELLDAALAAQGSE